MFTSGHVTVTRNLSRMKLKFAMRARQQQASAAEVRETTTAANAASTIAGYTVGILVRYVFMLYICMYLYTKICEIADSCI